MGSSAFESQFRGYARPSSVVVDELWTSGLIVLDTNVLLGLYRTTISTRDALLAVMDAVRDRLWMPHQVGLEFHKMRAEVRRSELAEPTKAGEQVERAVTNAIRQIKPVFDGNDAIDSNNVLRDGLREAAKYLADDIRKGKDARAYLAEEPDPILARLNGLYGSSSSVGRPFSEKKLRKARKAARQRFEARQPPGFADAGKPGDLAYGDCFIWFQILSHARRRDTGIILVTNDEKEDWRYQGEVRPELLDEFARKTGNSVTIVHPDTFVTEAKDRQLVSEPTDVETASVELGNYSKELAANVANQDRRLVSDYLRNIGIGETVAKSLMRSMGPLPSSSLFKSAGLPIGLSTTDWMRLNLIDWGAVARRSAITGYSTDEQEASNDGEPGEGTDEESESASVAPSPDETE